MNKKTNEDHFVRFSNILPLRVYTVRNGYLVAQNYG